MIIWSGFSLLYGCGLIGSDLFFATAVVLAAGALVGSTGLKNPRIPEGCVLLLGVGCVLLLLGCVLLGCVLLGLGFLGQGCGLVLLFMFSLQL